MLLRRKAIQVEQFVFETCFQIAGDHAPGFRLAGQGRHGGNDVIEQSIVFVVVQEQDCSAPNFRIFCECFEHFVNKVSAVRWRCLRMLAILVRSNNPAHLCQPSGDGIVAQILQRVIGDTFLYQWTVGIRAFLQLVRRKEFKGIVSVVIGGRPWLASSSLVEPPADAGCFQSFRIRGPCVTVGIRALP